MKKVLLVVLCLLVATAAFAQTSDPSNTVGYVKFTAGGGSVGAEGSTAFGLPFVFWDVVAGVPQYGVVSTKPSDIIGEQSGAGTIATGDLIVQQGGSFAWRVSGTTWGGGLEVASGMIPGKAYWYQSRSATRDVVLAGEVDNTGGYGAVSIGAPPTQFDDASTPYSWRDSRARPVGELGLVAAGFSTGVPAIAFSDKVVQQGAGGGFAYYTGTVFAGALTAITPGKAYWIVNKHPGAGWSYDYDGTASAALIGSDEPTGATTAISKSPATKDVVAPNAKVTAPEKVKKPVSGSEEK